MTVEIHSSAIIDKGAQIGEGTKVWHWVHICSNAKIGKACTLGLNVFIGNEVIVGDNCKIQYNVSFTNVYNPRSFIDRKKEYRETLVKKGATLGANSTIICGITIGEYAFIGAGALINTNVKPYALMAGVPAKQIGWMSAYGEKLNLPITGKGNVKCSHTGIEYTLQQNNVYVR